MQIKSILNLEILNSPSYNNIDHPCFILHTFISIINKQFSISKSYKGSIVCIFYRHGNTMTIEFTAGLPSTCGEVPYSIFIQQTVHKNSTNTVNLTMRSFDTNIQQSVKYTLTSDNQNFTTFNPAVYV